VKDGTRAAEIISRIRFALQEGTRNGSWSMSTKSFER